MPELRVECLLPFSWSPLPAAAELPGIRQGTRLLLRVLNQLEAGTGHAEEIDRHREGLDAKLDLLLFWLGQSLYGHLSPPPAVPLRLGLEGLVWPRGVSPPQPGEAILVSLQPLDSLVAPLRLPARVTAVTASDVHVAFDHLDEDTREQWEQWLFRRHRRAIHAQR